jgi:hypothetical protein
MTNTNANTDASVSVTERDAMTDSASAMTEDTHLTITDSLADAITKLFDSTLTQLVALRDERYAAAIEDLEHEAAALAKEDGQLEADIASLEAVLPSKERLTQHQIDTLLVEGKRYEVKDKLSELAAYKHKLVTKRERQKEISARLEAIGKEKRDIAKQVFEEWFAKVQPVVRAAEHGLFIVLLNGLEQSCYEYQERTDTGPSAYGVVPYVRPLLSPERLTSLTADERSEEWRSGVRWYGGR